MPDRGELREKGNPGDKHVIIDDLTSYDKEIGIGRDIKRRSVDFSWLKNIFVFFLLVGIVVGSFWISFLIGKRVLAPVKPLKSEKVIPLPKEEPAAVLPEKEEPSAVVADNPETKPVTKPEPMSTEKPEPVMVAADRYYKVHVGSFLSSSKAYDYSSQIKRAGFPTYVKKTDSGDWTVQAGAFKLRSQSESLVARLKAKGFESSIVYE